MILRTVLCRIRRIFRCQGNSGLFPQAESVHTILDSWKPATSTQLVAIAGWGLPTDVGVNYFQKDSLCHGHHSSPGQTCSSQLQIFGYKLILAATALYRCKARRILLQQNNIFNLGSYDKETRQRTCSRRHFRS